MEPIPGQLQRIYEPPPYVYPNEPPPPYESLQLNDNHLKWTRVQQFGPNRSSTYAQLRRGSNSDLKRTGVYPVLRIHSILDRSIFCGSMSTTHPVYLLHTNNLF